MSDEIKRVSIESELKQSYIDYAMSVLVGRALPDVRDGLKPVHKRILFAMHELNNHRNKPHKKSARIVGDVIGKYHPHGELAVYHAMVRMAQEFSMRYELVDGQGNFGSIDGDSPASMRYTEVRMSHLTGYMLMDLDKNAVDFVPNYDNTEMAPVVLPTRFPNLLINGASGIAVGMATNIPPHHMGEVIDGVLHLIDHPLANVDDLMAFIQGPDFPTRALIHAGSGIRQAYATGRGKIYLRARAHIENQESDKPTIVITEIPYQVNKLRLVEKIMELGREKKIEGIALVRDESDKDGLRVVVELKRGENPEVILNRLYSDTQMQVVFGINMVVMDDNKPKLMTLKGILEAFIDHRRSVVTRRSRYEWHRAKKRAHVLEGLAVALSHIDEMIALIKQSPSVKEARESMMGKAWGLSQVGPLLERAGLDVETHPQVKNGGYWLTEEQAQAILELKLNRLTNLEQDKIRADYGDCVNDILELEEILSDNARLLEVIKAELLEVKERFQDDRKSELVTGSLDFSDEDFIADEPAVITLSEQGYLKRQSLDLYQSQHRGGRGRSATQMKDDDALTQVLLVKTHDYLLFFSNQGRMYWKKAYHVPESSRVAKGRPIVNLLPLQEGEAITAVLPVRTFDENKQLVMVTGQGTIKRVSLDQFSRPRASGIIAITLQEEDTLVGVSVTEGDEEIMLVTKQNKAIRFNEVEVRSVGRSAQGVRGIRLQSHDQVVALVVCREGQKLLVVSQYGYGKCTEFEHFRRIARGGQGVIVMQASERNGDIISARAVSSDDDVLLITSSGTLVRTLCDEIPTIGRNTQGVRLIRLGEGEVLTDVRSIPNALMES